MKNLKVFVIMVMLAASLVGCGEKEMVNTEYSPNEKVLVENVITETVLVENVITETTIK